MALNSANVAERMGKEAELGLTFIHKGFISCYSSGQGPARQDAPVHWNLCPLWGRELLWEGGHLPVSVSLCAVGRAFPIKQCWPGKRYDYEEKKEVYLCIYNASFHEFTRMFKLVKSQICINLHFSIKNHFSSKKWTTLQNKLYWLSKDMNCIPTSTINFVDTVLKIELLFQAFFSLLKPFY